LTALQAFDVEGYTFRKDEHDGHFHRVIFDRDVVHATVKEGDDDEVEEETGAKTEVKATKAGRRDEKTVPAGAAPAKRAKK
jgi:hypothetical protein